MSFETSFPARDARDVWVPSYYFLTGRQLDADGSVPIVLLTGLGGGGNGSILADCTLGVLSQEPPAFDVRANSVLNLHGFRGFLKGRVLERTDYGWELRSLDGSGRTTPLPLRRDVTHVLATTGP